MLISGAMRDRNAAKSAEKPRLTNTPSGYIMIGKYTTGGYLMNGEHDGMDCRRHKVREEGEAKALIHRLNRIEGQIRGIRGMVEKNAYCPDILTQSSAVAAAINAFNRELLASHIHTCVLEDIRQGREGTVDELMGILQKLMK